MSENDKLTNIIENQDIKVSVIIPIYNAYDYLRPAMESVLDQTLREIEVICVDDGSTDHSLDILKEYQKLDARVRIVTEMNAGPALARNAGFKRARGEYVIFLDADDFFEPTLLEKMYELSVRENLDVAIARYDIYNSKKAVFQENRESEHIKIYANGTVTTSKNEHPDTILQSTTGSAWNKMLRRTFIIEKNIHFLADVMMFEDVFFTVSALAFAERVSLVPEMLVHHRTYNEQSRAKRFRTYYKQVPEVYLKIKEFLMKGGMYEPLSKGFLNLTAGRCYAIFGLLRGDEKTTFWNMLHDSYNESLGWQSHPAEDFESAAVCEFAANVELYNYAQYCRRCNRGLSLDNSKIDHTLKQNKQRKQITAFFKSIFGKKEKGV
jgi:glycosyltransferase involved in cell wall biosynthesis